MTEEIILVDKYKLVVDATIAEGGFGYVYRVRETQSEETFALKKINATEKDTQLEVENEIDILKALQKHPHIMEFIASTRIDLQPQGSNKYTYYILSEHCSRGTLTDLKLPIQELERSCRIIYQIALALKHMHGLGITHRDIKAENVLFDNSGRVKLCDFGSSTRKQFEPSISWTPLERSTVEDEMQRHTTPLYRPPEALETYLHYPIGCAIDIWALGCLTYFIRFGQHAFPDSGKLSIINCCYTIPKDVPENDTLVLIIRKCLKPDPRERLSIESLIGQLELEFLDMDLEGAIVPFTPGKKQKPPPPPTRVESAAVHSSHSNDLPNDLLLEKPAQQKVDLDALLDFGAPNCNGEEILRPKKTTTHTTKRGAFDDLLDSFGTSLPNNGESIPVSTCSFDGFGFDPKLRIQDWKQSRSGNIRALLSSLHLVLSDDFKWKAVGMHQLVTDSDVKKIYRLACLAVHPDKVSSSDDDTKEIANMVFRELNEAWSKFEK